MKARPGVFMLPAFWAVLLILTGFWPAHTAFAQTKAANAAIAKRLFDQKDYLKALHALDRAIDQGSRDPVLYYDRGFVSVKIFSLMRAHGDFTTAIRLAPDMIPAWDERCNMEMKRHNYTDASDDCFHAMALDKKAGMPSHYRSPPRCRPDDCMDAIAADNAAIDANPHDVSAHAHRAYLIHIVADGQIALRATQQAGTRTPKSAAEFLAQAFSANQVKSYPLALRAAEDALALEPKNPKAMFERAYALSGLLRFPESEKQLDLLLAGNGKDADALTERSTARAMQGKLAGALADINLAMSIEPQSGELLITLGETYRMMKKFDLARAAFEKSAILDPTLKDPAKYFLAKLPPRK